LYRGLNKDIKQAVYWKRCIDGSLIAGMPPEISTEIMLRFWEDARACVWDG
jgi:hypothetical protein